MRTAGLLSSVAGLDSTEDAAAPGKSVVTTGDVHVRTGPGLSYDSVGVVSEGGNLSYLDETFTDERGVTWYKVAYDGEERWVSSTYAVLTD